MNASNKVVDNNLTGEHSVPYHIPVLLEEAIKGLNIKSSGVYVDCTFGGGGHSREILKHLDKNGRLFAFDQDADAKMNVPDDERLVFIPHNFRHLEKFLRLHKCLKVDGILADLGVSSYQFDQPERGFSTRFDADLDMRMDKRNPVTAAEIIAHYTELQLQKMFEKYGEVTNAKTLARTIVGQRHVRPIKSVSHFKQSVLNVVKGNPHKYFAQVFQALRMEVNDEIQALNEMMVQSLKLLKPGGRLVIITFHSIEDRAVKNFLKSGYSSPSDEFVFGNGKNKFFDLINKKPVVAGLAELKSNPRARSAKLRIAEKRELYER